MPMRNGQYTYKEKAVYHSGKSKRGSLSTNGIPLSDFARGRHSAFAQINWTKNRQYRHKKQAEAQSEKYGYPSLKDFNNSPEGVANQNKVSKNNYERRRRDNIKRNNAIQRNY